MCVSKYNARVIRGWVDADRTDGSVGGADELIAIESTHVAQSARVDWSWWAELLSKMELMDA